MAISGRQAASAYGPAATHQVAAHAVSGDTMRQSVYSSMPGVGSSGGGGAVHMHTLNGVRPMHPSERAGSAAGLDSRQAHETSNGDQAAKSRSSSPVTAQLERSQPNQGISAATYAPAGFAAAAGHESRQGDPPSDALMMVNQGQSQTAAASVSRKVAAAENGATSHVVPVQSGLVMNDASKDSDMEEASELIESQMLTSGQSISQNLLAD